MTAVPAGLLPTPQKKPNELIDRTNRILKLTPGKATGRLIGGNLTMIATLMGTPYQHSTTNAIIFLEDVHESPTQSVSYSSVRCRNSNQDFSNSICALTRLTISTSLSTPGRFARFVTISKLFGSRPSTKR